MLSLPWLKKALKHANITFPESFINQVFFQYDVKKRACIDCDQLIRDVVGQLSPTAMEMVEHAFDSLDVHRLGVLSINDLARKYIAHGHPEVTSGRKTAENEYLDFLSCFEMGAEIPQKVTKSEFIAYHESVALLYSDEQAFLGLVQSTWGLTDDMIESLRSQRTAVAPVQQQSLKSQDVLERFPTASPKPRSPYSPNRKDIKTGLPEDDPRGGVPFLLSRIRVELQRRGLGGILSFHRTIRYLVI